MNAKCLSCGANQNLNESSNCNYCGNLIDVDAAVNFYKSSVSGNNGNLILMAETATDAGNYEDAVLYFNKILELDSTNADAWLGKGIGTVNTSKIGNLKIKEAINYWTLAIEYSKDKEAMSRRVALEIHQTVSSFYPTLENHFVQFITVDSTFLEHLQRYILLNSALEYALKLDPKNLEIIKTGIRLSKRVTPSALAIRRPKKQELTEKEKIRWKALSGLPESDLTIGIRKKYFDMLEIADPILFQKIKEWELECERIQKIINKQSNKVMGIAIVVVLTTFGVSSQFTKDEGALFWLAIVGVFIGFVLGLVLIKMPSKPDAIPGFE